MPDYLFKDRHLGLSSESVHLLRNGYNHTTIPWSDISSAEIDRGNVLKNKRLLLIIGLGLVGLAINLTIQLISNYLNDSVRIFYIEGILVPLFPFLIGGYSIYAVVRKEPVIIFRGEKKFSFSIKQ